MYYIVTLDIFSLYNLYFVYGSNNFHDVYNTDYLADRVYRNISVAEWKSNSYILRIHVHIVYNVAIHCVSKSIPPNHQR